MNLFLIIYPLVKVSHLTIMGGFAFDFSSVAHFKWPNIQIIYENLLNTGFESDKCSIIPPLTEDLWF